MSGEYGSHCIPFPVNHVQFKVIAWLSKYSIRCSVRPHSILHVCRRWFDQSIFNGHKIVQHFTISLWSHCTMYENLRLIKKTSISLLVVTTHTVNFLNIHCRIWIHLQVKGTEYTYIGTEFNSVDLFPSTCVPAILGFMAIVSSMSFVINNGKEDSSSWILEVAYLVGPGLRFKIGRFACLQWRVTFILNRLTI